MQNRKYINDIKLLRQIKVIDLRPISSFKSGHIPNSISFPVLEKSEITQLKKSGFASSQGRKIAVRSQLKLSKLRETFKNESLILVCRDGGLVSKYTWDNLRLGQETYVLNGGYKSFRKQIKNLFSQTISPFVLCGKTGSGKTELLELLFKDKMQVINLEKLAGHAGSVFGNLENKPQPTQEQFENNLAFEIQNLDHEKPVVLEYETANIGRITIPKSFIEQLTNAKPILINTGVNERVKRLVRVYANINDQNLKAGIELLGNKIGVEKADQISKALQDKNYAFVAAQLLEYFDQTKGYSGLPFENYLAVINGESIRAAAIEIQNLFTKKKRPPKGTLL